MSVKHWPLGRMMIVVGIALLLLLARPTPIHGSSWAPWQRYYVTGYDDTGLTATGPYAGPGTIAVDPRVIPLHAIVQVRGLGTFRALDTGGAIIGYRLDAWEPTAARCYAITGSYFVRWKRTP